ncbi:hypothetical protein L0F63_004760 [Massospora cicadina]|nr:hypothetical protein L0F63_004760 [Massospora cicadina]
MYFHFSKGSHMLTLEEEHVFGKVQPLVAIDWAVLVLGLLGIGLNGVLLHITRKRHNVLQKIDSIFLLVVAVMDLLACLFMTASVVMRWVFGKQIMDERGALCAVGSVLLCALIATSMVATALLALVRYLVIVHDVRIERARFLYSSAALLLCVFLMIVIRGATTRMSLRPSGLYCVTKLWGVEQDTRIFGMIGLILTVASLLCVVICYTKLALHYHRLVHQSIALGAPTLRSRSVVVQMFIVIVAYLVATMPEFVSVWYSRVTIRTSTLDGIVCTLLFSVTLINALFALLMHEETRRAFVKLISLSAIDASLIV